MQRVHRQVSDTPPFDQVNQPLTPEPPTTSPSPRQFIQPGTPRPVQSPTFQQPTLPPPRLGQLQPLGQRQVVRPAGSPFSPPGTPGIPSQQGEMVTSPGNEEFLQNQQQRGQFGAQSPTAPRIPCKLHTNPPPPL